MARLFTIHTQFMADGNETRPISPTSLIGNRVGRFDIQALIGSGGMGEVYLGYDTTLKRPVALKRITPRLSYSEEYRQRFLREAEGTSKLNHPNITALYDIFQDRGETFLIMEYVEGVSLRTTIGKPHPVSNAIRIIIQCAEAVAASHEKGILHRDIKPENILVDDKGRVKVCDFGLAVILPGTDDSTVFRSPTTEDLFCGTPGYSAPEALLQRSVDGRSDIFSLGVVLYELLAGRHPFRDSNFIATTNRILNEQPRAPSDFNQEVTPELDAVVAKMISKQPTDRFADAPELLDCLKSLASPEPQRIRKSIVALIAVLSTVLVVIATTHLTPPISKPLTERDSILLSEFLNTTGEPVFDQTLKGALAVQLEQSPFLDIFPELRARETLRFMGRPSDEPLTSETTRQVCQREAIKAMVSGSIMSLGTHYVIGIEALNCESGEVLARDQTEVNSREGVLRAVGELASNLRVKLGESLASIDRFNVPIESATTPSLDAFRAFTLGNIERSKGNSKDAVTLYKHAIEIDPNFAMACARLGAVYNNLEQRDLASEYAKRAFNLKDHVTERERFYISTTYYNVVTGEWDQSKETYEVWKRTYPRDRGPNTNLASVYVNVGEFNNALDEAVAGLKVGPNSPIAHWYAAQAFVNLNRFDEARAVLENAYEKKLDNVFGRTLSYWIAFVQNDQNTITNILGWAGNNREGHWILSAHAQAMAFSGRLQEARRQFDRALEMAEQSKAIQNSALIAGEYAIVEAELGDPNKARQLVNLLLQNSQSRDALGLAAIALARIHDSKTTELIDKLKVNFPTDTRANAVWIPSASALFQIAENPLQAISLLKAALPYEFGSTIPVGTSFRPIYARGLAYLAAGMPIEAADEFQKVLSRRGVAPVSPLFSLSQLGLARALTNAGDYRRSQSVYSELMLNWKSADSSLERFREAAKEFEALQTK